MNRVLHVFAAVLLLCSIASPVAAVQNETTHTPVNESSSENEGFGDDLADSIGEEFEDKLKAVLFGPFRVLAQQLLNVVVDVLTNTPDVHPNPPVDNIYRLALSVTYLLGFLAFTATGYLYLIGPILGYNYSQIHPVLPRILAALIFASISPILLQYSVELADALTEAFQPQDFTMSVGELYGLASGLVIAWVIQAAVLLTLVAMFVIRNVYILFIAAISPLVAIAWAVPFTKPYADQFISGYWTALMMAPLDVLALRFTMTLLQADGANIGQSVSNWIIGVASFTLLIILPWQLYGASQTAVSTASRFSKRTKHRAKQFRGSERHERLNQWKNRKIRRTRHRFTRNRFETDGGGYDWEDDGDDEEENRGGWR